MEGNLLIKKLFNTALCVCVCVSWAPILIYVVNEKEKSNSEMHFVKLVYCGGPCGGTD